MLCGKPNSQMSAYVEIDFNKGFSAVKEVGFFSSLWLFIIYPIVLAFGYIIGE